MDDAQDASASKEQQYQQAKALVLDRRKASVAMVQVHLRVGYNTACALFERMQAEGLVEPVPGEHRRWVLTQKAVE